MVSLRTTFGTVVIRYPTATAGAAGQGSGTTAQWSFGDFNGDGAVDAFSYEPGVSGADMYLGGGARLTHDRSWTDAWNGGRSWYVGDFNGDGRDDILRTRDGVSDADIFLSDGAGFAAGSAWLKASGSTPFWYVGDFNADGRDDLMRYVPNVTGAEVFLSTGTGFAAPQSWSGFGPGSQGWYVGDFDGDGRTDLLRVIPGLAGGEVLLSDGTMFGSAGIWTTHLPSDRWTVLDVNGDGRDDLLDGAGRILLSTGSAFDYLGDLDLAPGSRVLASTRSGTGVDLLVKNASDRSLATIGLETVDLEAAAAPLALSLGGSPRLASVGEEIELAFGSLAEGVEARLIATGDGFSWEGNWSSGSVARFTPESAGQYLFSVQYREVDGETVFEQAYGRATTVMPPDHVVTISDRLVVERHSSGISEVASQRDWREGITSFEALQRFADDLYARQDAGRASDDIGGKAIFLLEFVANLWAYGNAGAPERVGEVTDNELTGRIAAEQVTPQSFIDSPVAGCEDFAAVLAVLLTRSGIENRIVSNPSHVFNEAKIDGRWWTLDATFGLAIDAPFDEALQSSSSPTLHLFDQEGRIDGSAFYRERLVEAVHEHIALIDHGVFPDAVRQQSIDYLSSFDYGAVFTDALDLSAWTAGASVPLDDMSGSSAMPFDSYLRLTSLERLTIAERHDDVSRLASAGQWREDIETFEQLRAAVDAQLEARNPDPTQTERGQFYLQWVSGIWGYGDVAPGVATTVRDLLAQGTSSAEDRAAVLAWLLAAADLVGRVATNGDGTFNEVELDGSTWVLDATGGIAFEGDWASVTDTAIDTTALLFAVDGQMADSARYDPRFARATQQTLVSVANGSAASNEYSTTEDWLLTRSYGQALLRTLDPHAPTLLSATRSLDDQFVPAGTTSLDFTLRFSERVDHLDVQDIVVRGTTAVVSAIASPDGGRSYAVTLAGGDLGQAKAAVSIALDATTDVADLAGNRLITAAPDGAAGYLVGVSATFKEAGIWSDASAKQWLVGDFDGDGKADSFRYLPGVSGAEMFLSDGAALHLSGSWTDHWNGGQPWYVGDFNGDGKDDIFRSTSATPGIDMFLSTGSAFAASGSWSDANSRTGRWYVGDFNGDGMDDVFRYRPGVSGADMFLSNGTGFEHAGGWTPAGQGSLGWLIGDFDGDGKDDLLRTGVGPAEASLFLSTGSGFTAAPGWSLPNDGNGRWSAADVNDDGLDDLVRYSGGSLEVRVSQGREFAPSTSWMTASLDQGSLAIGDFNGDGAADFLGYLTGRPQELRGFLSDWGFD